MRAQGTKYAGRKSGETITCVTIIKVASELHNSFTQGTTAFKWMEDCRKGAINIPYTLEHLEDLTSASMWFYGKGVNIKKRPDILSLPKNLDAFRNGVLAALDTLNIFKWTRMALLHPQLATLFHRLVTRGTCRKRTIMIWSSDRNWNICCTISPPMDSPRVSWNACL